MHFAVENEQQAYIYLRSLVKGKSIIKTATTQL